MRTSSRPNAARQMTGLTMAGAAKLSRGRPACSSATRQASHCSKRRVGSQRQSRPQSPITVGLDATIWTRCHGRGRIRRPTATFGSLDERVIALAETKQCAWRLAEALDLEALPGLNSTASVRAPRSCRIPGLSGTRRLRTGISPLPRRPESHLAETSSAWRAGITPAAAG